MLRRGLQPLDLGVSRGGTAPSRTASRCSQPLQPLGSKSLEEDKENKELGQEPSSTFSSSYANLGLGRMEFKDRVPHRGSESSSPITDAQYDAQNLPNRGNSIWKEHVASFFQKSVGTERLQAVSLSLRGLQLNEGGQKPEAALASPPPSQDAI